jgi:PQQ-like domain
MRMRIVNGLAAACVLVAAFQAMPPAPPGATALGSSPSVPRLAWRLELPGYAGVHLGPASPKVLALFTDRPPHTAVAVNLRTGAVVWKSADQLSSNITVFAADADRFYLLSARDQQVSAWAWDTGTRLWTSHAHGESPWTTGAYALLAQKGRVVWIAHRGYLIAADGATGRKLWDRGFAYQDLWAPQAIALGNVYVQALSMGNSGLIVLDLKTGAVVRQGVFNVAPPGPYAFYSLRWSPGSQLFYGQDGVDGAGIHESDVRVLRPDLSLVWQREQTRNCRAAGDVLLCHTYYRRETGAYVETGAIALELATGRTLWRRTVQEDPGTLVGEWNGTAIVAHGGKLDGLRPRDGEVVWSLPVSFGDARIYGPLLVVVARATPGQPARVEAYRMP